MESPETLTTSSDLDSRQEIALLALARGKRIIDAAKEAGVTDRTLRNWKQDPEFMMRLRRETASYIEDLHGGVRSLGDRALLVLADLLDREDVDDRTRLRAALEILRHGNRLDREQIEERLLAVEERLEPEVVDANVSEEFPWTQ